VLGLRSQDLSTVREETLFFPQTALGVNPKVDLVVIPVISSTASLLNPYGSAPTSAFPAETVVRQETGYCISYRTRRHLKYINKMIREDPLRPRRIPT